MTPETVRLALQAISLTVTLLQGMGRYQAAIGKINALLQTVQAEGRDVTEAEWQALLADDDVARARLQAEIDAAS